MEIKRVTGCLANVFDVDGVEWKSLPDEKKTNILNNILDKVISEAHKNVDGKVLELLDYLQPDTYESEDNACETCGDYITEETWVI